ncbi:bleomycin hydrolase [Exophiala xenobiotica]|uniref:Cysteine proteinase 1, mitochondrial n=1 Tax=Lithohypha guttulata TaxID=1690604 RepID=A0ABR0KJZ3_9EURO|nr:bleomycin hydrolase [Lithohypha guttulata]KAK5325381.1 bleomycin hydrolase [Exophiala xenobiotica]
MGSGQSVQAENAAEQRVIDQLRAIRIEDRLRQQEIEKEYIHVDNEKVLPQTYSVDPSLSLSQAEEWEKTLLQDPKNRLALGALVGNDVDAVLSQKAATFVDTQLFNVKIPFEGAPITNQRSSGRCWLFATTNVHRVAIMKKHNLKEFELSQAYLYFWDKLEKANWFLEQIIDTAEQDLDSRLVQELLKAPVNDGGQWTMANSLVYKYGLVPQTLYPDSYNAMSSSKMGRLITSKLRSDALALRSLVTSSKSSSSMQKLLAAKARMMQEVHCILTLMLGPPPKPDQEFTWEYYDANNAYHKVHKTPLQLAMELSSPTLIRSLSGCNVNNLFSLVNDPRHKYLTHMTVDRLGNVVGGRSAVTYINVDMATIKRATIKTLKAGIPVFFGSDVGKFSNSAAGIMDTKLYDYDLAFGSGNGSLQMSKSQRLRVGESQMTHAMVLTAVQVDEKTGKSVRWRVQNSWGENAGSKGWFVMTDEWMDEFVYQVVVDPSVVENEVRDALKTEPMVLPLWDPMGALA